MAQFLGLQLDEAETWLPIGVPFKIICVFHKNL